MGQRTRQSNSAECCPLCSRQLTNRVAAVSHYRAHVRAGELKSKHEGMTGEGFNVYRITEAHRKTVWEDRWWSHGFPPRVIDNYGHPDSTTHEERAERARVQFHVAIVCRAKWSALPARAGTAGVRPNCPTSRRILILPLPPGGQVAGGGGPPAVKEPSAATPGASPVRATGAVKGRAAAAGGAVCFSAGDGFCETHSSPFLYLYPDEMICSK